MLIANLLSSIGNDDAFKRCRVAVYTVGGTQIGFAGLGEGKERLTFPGHWSIGEALRNPQWARFSTDEELVADPHKFSVLSKPMKGHDTWSTQTAA